jgi:hypothetical protein
MIERMLRVGVIASVFALVLPGSAVAQRPAVESERLAALLEARGFEPPEGFKALVIRLEPADGGGFTARYHDWRGTSDDRTDWWPASSIKIYAAVAAIERMAELGFPMRTFLTYHYEKDGEPDEVTARFDQIVHRAIAQSSNPDFDMLVELVGFDEINRDFFVRQNGFRDTVFLRGYSNRDRDPVTSINSARPSPRITLRYGRRERVLPARVGEGDYACPDEGNCTTLQDLAEVMRRIMLHGTLPPRERYDISDDAMEVLRGAMAIARNRRLADVFVESFGDVPVEVWHKPGFAMRWISDTLFIHRTDTGERWIVAMAGRFGRRSLDDAAAHIAALLRSRALCEEDAPASD